MSKSAFISIMQTFNRKLELLCEGHLSLITVEFLQELLRLSLSDI